MEGQDHKGVGQQSHGARNSHDKSKLHLMLQMLQQYWFKKDWIELYVRYVDI